MSASSSRSTGCATSSPTRRNPARTAAAISPMRSMCWRATAPRRSATCATSPTPSSTTSPPRSPRRRSPRRSACSATGCGRSGSMRRQSRRSAPPPRLEFGRRGLRLDAARCGGGRHAGVGRRRPAADHHRRGAEGRGRARRRVLHLDPGGGLDGAGGPRARQADARCRSMSAASRSKAPLYRTFRAGELQASPLEGRPTPATRRCRPW